MIAFPLTRYFSRRSILICGTIGMALGHLLMFVNYMHQMPTAFMLCTLLVPTGAFTLSLAPLSWVLLSELYPNRIRGKAMSLATCAMFAASFVTATYFPTILNAFKDRFGHPGGTFLIFMGICLLCSFFVWSMVPETKDKSLEEIGEYWLRNKK
jgi:MFS family permease